MKREIKFRGLSFHTKEFVYGSLINNMWTYSENSEFPKDSNVCEIITGNYESDFWSDAIEEDSNRMTVLTDSVGQYTGLKDKNGVEIYEGDHFGNELFSVCFNEGCFRIGQLPLIGYLNGEYMEQLDKVIGNIHQTQEI